MILSLFSFTSLNTRKKNTSDILMNQDGADTSLDKIPEMDANDAGQEKVMHILYFMN